MWTVVVSVLAGVIVGLGLGFGGMAHWAWSIVWGLLTFGACQAGIGWMLRQRIKTMMDHVQGIIAAGQKRLQQKTEQWQFRPPGSIKQAKRELEREQRNFVTQAIVATDAFERYYRWSPLLRRQIDTLRMQLYFQIKDYAAVDRLLPRCLYIEPMTAAIRMARMVQRKEEEGLDKFFEKQVRRLRYGQGTILYALRAWIALRHDDVDKAHEILLRASEKMENDTIKRNLEHLTNNRVRQFSNAGLGDEWYALGLEEPRIKAQRQRMPPARMR